MTLANIYAPNNDDPFFFENVFKHLLTFECEEIILVGDFHLVLDVQKDKTGGNPVTHEKSLQKVKYIIDSLDLTDIWLFLNADTKRFTRIGEDEIRRCLFNINNFKGGHLAMLQNEPFTHNITALLFGLIINDAKDLLLHYLLLLPGIIFTPVNSDTRPNVQMYIQTVQRTRTAEIERQIAKDHNS